MSEKMLTAVFGVMLPVFVAYLDPCSLELRLWIGAVFMLLYGIGITGRWWRQLAAAGLWIRWVTIVLWALFPVYLVLGCPVLDNTASQIFVGVGLSVDALIAFLPPRCIWLIREELADVQEEESWAELAFNELTDPFVGSQPRRAFVTPWDWHDPLPNMYVD